jgi:hypothetical protein
MRGWAQKPGLDAAGALPDLHGFFVGIFMLVRGDMRRRIA